MGVVAGPLAVAGFVMPANRAMETIEVPTAHTAPHAELGPAPPTSKRGAAATADSLSTAHLVNSPVLSPLINVRPLQLRSPQVPVSLHATTDSPSLANPVQSFDSSSLISVGPSQLHSTRVLVSHHGTADPQSPANPVHSFDSSPSINICPLQWHSSPAPVSQHAGLQPVSSSSEDTTSTLPAACPLKPVSQLSPIVVDRLQYELRNYPHPDKAAYVIQGLRHGFHLGFNHKISLKSASGNMASAVANPQVIDNYLHTEVQLGRVAGPFLRPPFQSLHVSRFGAIPKHNQPGKWRLILDLSSPSGHSVNDGIASEDYSLQYMKVDDIMAGIMQLGRGTLMAKFDVQSAYRIVPIHPEDRPLLCMKWQGAYYVDMVLPFGVRSAPYIFTCIADLVEWIAKQNYNVSFLMHYLDDFHTLGPPGSLACQRNLDNSIHCFSQLGIPLHPEKFEGPCTCMTVLGIELDSVLLQARLPKDKFDNTTALLEQWSHKRSCKRKDLESLIGHLQHACKVVPQGRSFLRRMINLLCAFRREDHPIRLNREFFLDLTWWRELFRSWNGCSFLQYPQWAPLPDFEVSSDASGALGYGALFQRQWFSGSWLASQVSQSIEYKELFPIVVAAYVWGPLWTSKRVNFRSDNSSVVAILRSGTSRAPDIMVLVRYLCLLAAHHSFSFTASSVRGKCNPIADALSRFQFQRFRQLAPHAALHQTQIPRQLLLDLDLV